MNSPFSSHSFLFRRLVRVPTQLQSLGTELLFQHHTLGLYPHPFSVDPVTTNPQLEEARFDATLTTRSTLRSHPSHVRLHVLLLQSLPSAEPLSLSLFSLSFIFKADDHRSTLQLRPSTFPPFSSFRLPLFFLAGSSRRPRSLCLQPPPNQKNSVPSSLCPPLGGLVRTLLLSSQRQPKPLPPPLHIRSELATILPMAFFRSNSTPNLVELRRPPPGSRRPSLERLRSSESVVRGGGGRGRGSSTSFGSPPPTAVMEIRVGEYKFRTDQ